MFPFGVLPELANLLRAQWEQALSLELATGQSIPWVFHWNDRGSLKEIHPRSSTGDGKNAVGRRGSRDAIPTTFGVPLFGILNEQGCPVPWR